MQIDFWDVGQGDCSVITLKDKRLVIIDVGPRSSPIINWLNDTPKTIEAIILTHNDADHIGALNGILTLPYVTINKVYLLNDQRTAQKYKELFAKLIELKNQIKVYYIQKDTVIFEDEDRILEVVFPDVLTGMTATTHNQASAILGLRHGDSVEFVWGGDAQFLDIVEAYTFKINPNVLVGPHHGAPTDRKKIKKYSLKNLLPFINYISVGTNNRYSHPCPSYIKFLSEMGIKTYCSEITNSCNRKAVIKNFHILKPEIYGHVSPTSKNVVHCRGGMQYFLKDGNWQIDGWDSIYLKKLSSLSHRLCIRP